jgi:acylphosphatase
MSEEEMVAFNACASGRVQGVGFRYTARYLAQGLGLAGWVRNADDGSVELFVQGPAEAVAKFLERIRDMPAPARVTSFNTASAAVLPGREEFEVEY